MASFFENYRSAKSFPGLGVPSTTFRNADQSDDVSYQQVSFRKKMPNGEYKNRNLLLVVPLSKTSGYATERTGTSGYDLTDEELEKIKTGNENRLQTAIHQSRPRVGLVKGESGAGEGEIFGAIDMDSGQSLTAKGTNDLMTKLEDSGFSIYDIQEPRYTTKSNNGYYPGDFIKEIFNIFPQRGTVTGTFPRDRNRAIIEQIRKYGNSASGGQ